MVLSDDFYYQPIRLDTINTQIYTDLIAKEGDAGGRGLKVTITENGVTKNTTGITLNLKWEHTAVADLQGLEPFEAVDLTKGIYKLKYPTNMLQKGTVKALIQIIDNGGLAGSRNLKIKVDSTVGDDTAMESSNEFTALVTALVKTNHMENLLNETIANVTVDSEVITARNSTAKQKTFTVLDERMEDLEKDVYYPANNELTQANFAATTGWSVYQGTLAVANNVASVTGTSGLYPNVYQDINCEVGDKLYYAAQARVTTAGATAIALRSEGVEITTDNARVLAPVANQWYQLDCIKTAFETTPSFAVSQRYALAADATGKVLQVKKPIALNLTKIFGANAIPTIEQIRAILSRFADSHFVGNEGLSQPALLMGKALSIEAQFNAAVAGLTVDDETINARVGKDNTTHATLKARLDSEKSTTDQSLVSLGQQLEQAVTTIGLENVIPNTVAKLKAGVRVSVCIMGDSLAEDGTDRWMNMLFSDDFNSTGVPHALNLKTKYGVDFTYVDMAIGGHTAHLQLAQLGFEREANYKTKSYLNQEISSEVVLSPSTLQKYDLFIISMGTNGGTEKFYYAESVVRNLVNAGKDVILTTGNPRTDNLNFANDIEAAHLKFGEYYRIGVANTNEYYRNELTNGAVIADLNRDVVHQTARGYELYAQSIYDLIDGSFKAINTRIKTKTKERVLPYTALTSATNLLPINVELQFPISHTGTETTSTSVTSAINPWFGRYLQIPKITLTVGQFAKFSGDMGFAFDILFYATATCNGKVQTKIQQLTADVGTPIQIGSGVAFNRVHLAEGLSAGTYSGNNGVNRAFYLVCTEGQVEIAGVALQTYATKADAKINKKTGTFETDLLLFGKNCIVSNDDTLVAESYFYGEGFKVNLISQRAGRKIDVYVDNLFVTNLDTYSALTTDHQVVTYKKVGFVNGKHKITLKINGVNASAVSPDGGTITEKKFILHSINPIINDDLNLLLDI